MLKWSRRVAKFKSRQIGPLRKKTFFHVANDDLQSVDRRRLVDVDAGVHHRDDVVANQRRVGGSENGNQVIESLVL